MARRPPFLALPLIALAGLSLTACSTPPPPKPAPTAASPFVATPVQGLGDPEVVVENKSGLPLTLEIKGEKGGTLQIAPGAKASMRVAGGPHAFLASSPGSAVAPLEGEETFLADYRYLWVFIVKSADPDEGKGWFCFTTGDLFLGCARSEAACKTRQAEPGKPGDPARGPCVATPEPWTFVDTDKKAEWFSADEASCTKARELYIAEAKPNPLAVVVCKTHP